jgi:hypothetical protein
MRMAKIVFTIAGILGLLELAPLYFMFNLIGIKDPPAITHPAFFYGFVGAGIAWQIGFLMIGRDPVRLRPMMLAGVIEKWTYAVAVLALYSQARLRASDVAFGIQDLTLGILFLVAFLKTAASPKAISRSAGRA